MEIITTVNIEENLPFTTKLNQNYPNPFNSGTTISYSILKDQNVKIVVYNNAGKQIANLVKQKQKAGNYNIK